MCIKNCQKRITRNTYSMPELMKVRCFCTVVCLMQLFVVPWPELGKYYDFAFFTHITVWYYVFCHSCKLSVVILTGKPPRYITIMDIYKYDKYVLRWLCLQVLCHFVRIFASFSPQARHRLWNDLNCVECDVKPCSTNQPTGAQELFFDWGSKSWGPHFEESTNLLYMITKTQSYRPSFRI